jgi:hypothetical protein
MQNTTFDQQITTTSPQKNHPGNALFQPTPFKIASIYGHKKAAHQGGFFSDENY